MSRKKSIMGFHAVPPDSRIMSEGVKTGYRFLALSLDHMFLGEVCLRTLQETRDELKEEV
jgi:hypothetical protein